MKKLKKEHTKIEFFVSQKYLFLVAFILILQLMPFHELFYLILCISIYYLIEAR